MKQENSISMETIESVENAQEKKELKIESISEKGSSILNEDAILMNDKIFGVFDGATGLDKYKDENGLSGGYHASNILKNVFARNDKPLRELVLEANEEIKMAMQEKKLDVSDKVNLWNSSASVVRIDKGKFDWLKVSDSEILVIYKDGTHKTIGNIEDHDLEIMKSWKKLADLEEENISEKLKSLTEDGRRLANIEYGAVNGKLNPDFIRTGTESTDGISDILIFSDGFFIPQEDPESSMDYDLLVRLYLEGGIEKVGEYVRKLEDEDPKCWKYPRFKQHDDMSAVAIKL